MPRDEWSKAARKDAGQREIRRRREIRHRPKRCYKLAEVDVGTVCQIRKHTGPWINHTTTKKLVAFPTGVGPKCAVFRIGEWQMRVWIDLVKFSENIQ